MEIVREGPIAIGDAAAIRRLQAGGLLRDTLRSVGLAALAVVAGWWLAGHPPPVGLGRWLSVALTGAGVAAAGAGALRCAGRGLRLRWLALGTLLGLVAMVTLR